MDEFLALINHPEMPWAIAIAILCIALLFWLRFSWLIRGIERQLQVLNRHFHQLDPQLFAQQFQDINQQLRNNKLTARQWHNFQQTLLPPRQSGEPYWYTVAPGHYFNEHSLIAANINLRLYQAIPNILVGIGIWFTFIGLVAALWFASQGVAAEDIVQAQTALKQLLHAATFKFVTSIAGLLASILFSWAEKARLHRLYQQLETFNQHLEACLLLYTAERISALQLQEAQKQNQQLNQLSTNWQSLLQPLEQQIKQGLQQLTEQMGSLNHAALQDLIESFAKQMQGLAGDELRQLAGTLKQLALSLETFQQRFEQTGNGMEQHVSNAAQQLQQVQNALGQNETGFLYQLNHLTQGLQDSAALLQNASAPLEQTAENFNHSLHQLNQLVLQLQETGTHLNQSSVTAAQALQQGSESVGRVWQQYEGHFMQVDESMAKVFKELVHGLDQYRHQVEAFTGQLDQSLSQGVQSLNGVIVELVEAVEDLHAQSRRQKTDNA
ncbi:hypothetical protein QUF61_17435 [Candidatus Venteria ishoeyi]|uniref:hypothetical protein n=1 Tax=Candidatus Venteria ishoeyi TaxID=1899563 RepID=UPI0025A636D8|nr:hypothetical protein [Candidatus Venteria ishoeyi]MDM8548277.1 hypothetical protein [Candidatus Venteria ishoeyi]